MTIRSSPKLALLESLIFAHGQVAPMISENFNHRQFIEALMDKTYPEILILTQQEVAEAERLTKPASKLRARAAAEYAAFLKAFLFFIGQGIKPGGILDEDFFLFRPLCERLVQTGQFKPTVLDFFKRQERPF